ncbi:MAG: methyltransferase domain-containing protein [Burkholderiales bacterium]|nr:methyltransferase domain-containing protein [Burkholderiales bacterium]
MHDPLRTRTRHLDLGCGGVPRNPYQRDELHGIDIAAPAAAPGVTLRQANLALQPIPYPDAMFDSVSAYDFFEHVPRLLPTSDGLGTRFPFIELMDEIWRVLRAGGLLYAQTPAYPHPAAFQDPTHVNFIAADTHHYFSRPQLTARMYGFRGDFLVRRVQRIKPGQAYHPQHEGWLERWRERARARRGALSHLVWELEAVKDAPLAR